MVGKKSWIEIKAPEEMAGSRLDTWVGSLSLGINRTEAQKMLKEEHVLVNHKLEKASYRLKTDDEISIFLSEKEDKPILTPCPMNLDILFEDQDILVLNKKPGISVHPGAGSRLGESLVEGLLAYFQSQNLVLPLEELGFEERRPFVVHRLDKDTSGVLIFAKSVLAFSDLKSQFFEKKNHRVYWAILEKPLLRHTINYESYLFRDSFHRKKFLSTVTPPEPIPKGYRLAKSRFEVLKIYEDKTALVQVSLQTGRTHQIRLHAQALGAPIIGDRVYGQNKKNLATRQLLHAKELGVFHPRSKTWMMFSAPLPKDFSDFMDRRL